MKWLYHLLFPSGVNLVWNLGVVDPGKTNFNFSRQVSEKFRFFSRNFTKKCQFSRQISENFDNFRQFKKNRFSRQKLANYSNFWANYSISLQRSPLSNILPVHDRYNNISRPVNDPPEMPLATPTSPLPKIWGFRPPTPHDWRPCFSLT